VYPALFAALTPGLLLAVEPPPRRPPLLPLKVVSPPTHISAARELPDGRLLVTDKAE
jgi:hypothetical protein